MVRSTYARRLPPFAIIGAAVLIGFDVAMASLSWTAWTSPLEIDVPANRSSLRLPQLPSPDDRVLVKRSVGVALARPLFSASRRPFQPPPPPAAPAAIVQTPPLSAIPDLVVDGIWLHGTDKRVHLRRRDNDGGGWRAEGDLADGWRIVSITPSNVTILSNSRAVILEMYPAPRQNAE